MLALNKTEYTTENTLHHRLKWVEEEENEERHKQGSNRYRFHCPNPQWDLSASFSCVSFTSMTPSSIRDSFECHRSRNRKTSTALTFVSLLLAATKETLTNIFYVSFVDHFARNTNDLYTNLRGF